MTLQDEVERAMELAEMKHKLEALTAAEIFRELGFKASALVRFVPAKKYEVN